MLFLKNKIAAITGAGSGIGKEVALLLASRGAKVYAIDINNNALNTTVSEINHSGGKAMPVICDVSDHQQVIESFRNIGHVQILVNSAGISHVAKVEDTSEDDIDRLYRVNVKGVYNCLYAVIPTMKLNNCGTIVNLASIANHIGLADRFAYSMTKGAVYAMTLSVARDYVHHGIRCNSVSPARVHTPFVDDFLKKNYPGSEKDMFDKLSMCQPMGRMAKPSEVASMILYLCSDEASFVTGCDYPVDGGVLHLSN